MSISKGISDHSINLNMRRDQLSLMDSRTKEAKTFINKKNEQHYIGNKISDIYKKNKNNI